MKRIELEVVRSMKLVIIASRGCALVAVNAPVIRVSETAFHPTLVIQTCSTKVSGLLVGFWAVGHLGLGLASRASCLIKD